MPVKKSIPDNIINPFSEAFIETWDLWKRYRWEEHKFKYKGCISEQVRLMELCTLSGGDEYKAIEIIKQSISNTWKGFFPLKIKLNGTGQASAAAIKNNRSDVQAELESRLRTRGQGASATNS